VLAVCESDAAQKLVSGVPANVDETDGYGSVNARFTNEPHEASWQFSVFGTNLTNEYILGFFFHGLWASTSRPWHGRARPGCFNFNFE
jgi:hypothetical protein